MSRRLPLATAAAFVNRDQFPLLDIKLLFSHYLPFVKAGPAKCFAFVFFFGAGAFKGKNVIAHSNVSRSAMEFNVFAAGLILHSSPVRYLPVLTKRA